MVSSTTVIVGNFCWNFWLRTKDTQTTADDQNDQTKIGSCGTIVCLFVVRSSWKVVWELKKEMTRRSLYLVLAFALMLVQSLLAWSRLLWSKHEMPAVELCDEENSEVQASAVSVREFRFGTHRQILIGAFSEYFFTFLLWDLRAIYLTWQQVLSLHNNSCNIDDETFMDGRCTY